MPDSPGFAFRVFKSHIFKAKTFLDRAGKFLFTRIGGRKGLAAFAWFTGQVKVKVEEALAADKDLSIAQYRLVVLLWLNTAGYIERVELQGTSNNEKTDTLIKKVLTGKLVANEPPPSDMPQPIKIRITSKNSGL